jgi:hypothetical protein
MTIVYVRVINPSIIYSDLNIPTQYHVSNQRFVESLKAELQSVLSVHGVKSVFINIQKNMENANVYDVSLSNVKNDWQEEKIREECDITCISFMKKENLINIK